MAEGDAEHGHSLLEHRRAYEPVCEGVEGSEQRLAALAAQARDPAPEHPKLDAAGVLSRGRHMHVRHGRGHGDAGRSPGSHGRVEREQHGVVRGHARHTRPLHAAGT